MTNSIANLMRDNIQRLEAENATLRQQLAAANARLDDLLKYFKSEQKRWDLESKRCGNEYHQGDAEGRSLAYKDAGKRLAAVAANWLPAEPQNQQGEE